MEFCISIGVIFTRSVSKRQSLSVLQGLASEEAQIFTPTALLSKVLTYIIYKNNPL